MKRTFVSVHGGLGNQLFQLGLAVKLSEQSNVELLPWKRHCRTDSSGKIWIDYYRLAMRFTPTNSVLDRFFIFYTRLCFKVLLERQRRNLGGGAIWLLYRCLIALPMSFGVRIITTAEMGDFEIPPLLRRNYVFAYFQTQQAAKAIREVLVKENAEIPPEVDEIIGLDKEVLVLHIRRTDYKENPRIGLLPQDYFRNALEELSKKYTCEELWLFSDDPQEAIFMVPEEFKSKLRVISDEAKTPNEVIALMAFGNSFILSNSTFGWWAANLAYVPPKHVIVPSKWFRHMDEPVGLIPIDWVRVGA